MQEGDTVMELQKRNDMNPAMQWDLSPIYPDISAWESAYHTAETAVQALPALQGTLGGSPQALLSGLETLYAAAEQTERVYLYAMLEKAGDNSDPQKQAMEARATNLYVALKTNSAFSAPEILNIPQDTLQAWMQSDTLAPYRHILEDIARGRAHTLNSEMEKMLAMLSDAAGAPDNAFTMLESVDMTFPKVPNTAGELVTLTHGNYSTFLESPKQDVRAQAFTAYHGEFQRFSNTFAALYAGSVKLDTYYSRMRGYDSACARALFDSNVPVAVYDSLTSAIHAGLPTLHRYLTLRKKVLGVKELHFYDLYCPMVEDADQTMTYEQAQQLVKAATAPLGTEYGKILDRAFAERWIDVYENRGKTTGAFSCGVYGVHPYVLLNFSGSLNDAFTLAHELGHTMHSFYSDRAQTFANHDYRILVAEVASTVNEVLLTHYLLQTETDAKRRAYILNHFLEGFRTTVYRQTLFAEFERKAHEMDWAGEPLTAESLSAAYHALNEQYYAGVVHDTVQDIEWARIPHFYNAFYVYQYATGFCSAVAIASQILKTGDASAYLQFLQTGGSLYPLEELKIAGVDLTKPDTVQNALQVFDERLTELARLLEQ